MGINKAWDYSLTAKINLLLAGNGLMGGTGKNDLAVIDRERRILNDLDAAKLLASESQRADAFI
jgi:hypothetical protein